MIEIERICPQHGSVINKNIELYDCGRNLKTDDIDIPSYLTRIEKNQAIIIGLLKELKSN